MATDTASPLRQRMIEDMNSRKLCAQDAYTLVLEMSRPARSGLEY
jgi:hypothetical protein